MYNFTEPLDETQNKNPTFVIKVTHKQNASWQGTIKWVEKSKVSGFRSVLELISLMNEAVGVVSPKWMDKQNSPY